MRDAKGKPLGNVGEFDDQHNTFADVDRLLREAQVAHEHKEYEKAVALAHTAAGVPIRTNLSWRIIGVSACHLKRRDILEYVVPHLDAASREFVRVRCEDLGFKPF